MDYCEELKNNCKYSLVSKYNNVCGVYKENGDATFYMGDMGPG